MTERTAGTKLFDRVARPAILRASRSATARRAATRLPLTTAVVRRFVAGETLDDAVSAVGELRDTARYVSVDYLGEDVVDTGAADATVRAYLELLDAFGRLPEPGAASATGPRPLEVSLKLSALGQALGRDGEKVALANAMTICARAREVGAWVTVDAEDHTTTDSTLSVVRALRAEYPWVGTVLQAYLKRTEADCTDLADTRIRLCKGAYDEPASVAHRDPAAVTEAYLRCLRVLMAGPGYPMVASHDPAIIDAAAELIAASGRGTDDVEYQMLYGVRDPEQRRLADAGNHVRVYVPFGSEWFGYFSRRLAERPANLAFFLRALAPRRG